MWKTEAHLSKRFFDTEMWNKRWIRLLKPEHKLFWVYLMGKCDHAGLWDVDIDLASFQLGVELNQEELLFIFQDKVKQVPDENKWFIPSFVFFQYGTLNPSNKVHFSVVQILKRYKIQAPCEEHIRGLQAPKDKDKDKEEDKAKKKEFEKLWKKYPRKKGKDRAYVHFTTQVRTPEDLININKAMNNYIAEIKRMKTEEQHVKHGSTWFNHNWKDDIDYKPPEQFSGKDATDNAEAERIFK